MFRGLARNARAGSPSWYVALWLSCAVILLDQGTKYWVLQTFELYERLPITSFFNVVLVYNHGAAFGILAQFGGWQRWFLVSVALTMSLVFTLWLRALKAHETRLRLALTLMLGGALGNLWDRWVLGYVVDFLDFYWLGWHWPAFNVADMAISIGAALFVVDALIDMRRAPS